MIPLDPLGTVAARFVSGFIFFYLQNIPDFLNHGSRGELMGPFWSLAVEEQFYLIWPIFVLLLNRKTLTWICGCTFCAALALRMYLVHVHPDDFSIFILPTSRADGLVIGAACAIYTGAKSSPVPRPWIAAACGLSLFILGYIVVFHPHELIATSNYTYTIGVTGIALLAGSAVAWSQHRPPFVHRVLTARWLRSIGKYSYGMYVYHMMVFFVCTELMRRIPGFRVPPPLPLSLLAMLALLGLTYLLAKLSYDRFEVHFLALKRYFEPVKERPVSPVEAALVRS
jgi:peptidoglycan/LPS O-acetylase OafA/YrhL